MREVTSSKLTAGALTNKFNESIKDFIASKQAFTFMNCIKETPIYWNIFSFDFLAMAR